MYRVSRCFNVPERVLYEKVKFVLIFQYTYEKNDQKGQENLMYTVQIEIHIKIMFLKAFYRHLQKHIMC